MSENSKDQLPIEQVEQLVREHTKRVIDLAGDFIEQKAKEILTKQLSEQKAEEIKKGRPLSGFLELTGFYTTQASSINRSLALAGVAIIWIFKKPAENLPIARGLLNFPLWCLVISLSLDLLQYFFGSIAWRVFYERKYNSWKKRKFETEYAKDMEAPNSISLVLDALFLFKIIFMIAAYWNIFRFLSANI